MTHLEQIQTTCTTTEMPNLAESRILVVDDNRNIHNDFRKILLPSDNRKVSDELDRLEALFNDTPLLTQADDNTRSIASAYQGEEAIELVKASLCEGTPFSLAFVDVRMPPGIDGIETAKAILDLDPEIQIVICSAFSDYSWHEIVERLGNSDRFLILKKPFDNIEVRQISSVLHSRWIESRSDILTGVLNRRAFGTHLIQQRKVASELGNPLACVMVDLDHFKRVNDVYGHLVGDQVLVAASKCLQEQCQPNDLICRYGGEEFCVILPNRTEDQACEWAEGARITLADLKVSIDGGTIGISGSFGVVSLNGSELSENGIFLDAADQAMFAAKKHGRNQVVKYSQLQKMSDGKPAALTFLDRVSAREVMTPVRTVSISDSIDIALQALVGAPNEVLVVMNKQDHVAGLISQQDLLLTFSENSFDQAMVESSMQTNTICFSAESPLSEIKDFLNRVQVPQVLITENDRPVGMIGRNSILERMLVQHPCK